MNTEKKEFINEEQVVSGFNAELKESVQEFANQALKEKITYSDVPIIIWAKGLKQGRNNKCACGSGKKYKHCCLIKEE